MDGSVVSSSFPAAPALTPGYKLDRYELLCPLAQGGMASVWLARLQGKHGFEKLVAVKTILPHFAADPRFRQMFLDEARIASRIEHANVAQILDLGEQHELLYLVMEWVDGDSLSKLSRIVEKHGQRIPLGILLRILADASAGLHAAHELCDASGHPLGVVHRDVSPQNILINAKGVVKIIDFGVAKARDRHAEETTTGILKGKIQYMAPEQATGKPLDRRADVWAIGAILYRMLAGRAPFEAENQLATLHLLSSGRPPPELPAHVPRPVAMIIHRAMTHDIEARFATAAELQAALESAMHTTRNFAQASDVAAYMGAHLAERAMIRKDALALALKSAAERSHIAKVFQASTEMASAAEVLRERPRGAGQNAPTARPGKLAQPKPITSTSDGEASIGTLATASIDTLNGPRAHRVSKRALAISLASASVVVGALTLWTRASGVREAAQQAQAPVTTAANPLTSAAHEMEPPAHSPPAAPPSDQEPEAPATTSPAPKPAPVPPRRAPKPIVSRPRTDAPSSAAPKKPRIDDGF
jgi:serine/threonine-protein kinase